MKTMFYSHFHDELIYMPRLLKSKSTSTLAENNIGATDLCDWGNLGILGVFDRIKI